MPGRLYAPGELDVLAGQTVTWRNTDSKSHTVTEDDDTFDSGYICARVDVSRPRSRRHGTFTYSLHASTARCAASCASTR